MLSYARNHHARGEEASWFHEAPFNRNSNFLSRVRCINNNRIWDVRDAGYEFEGSEDLSVVDIEASDGGEGKATNMCK